MKKGKPSYNSMIRSVLRVPFERKEKDHIGQDGVFAGKETVISVNAVVSGGEDAERLAFYRAYNDALAGGCAPEKLIVSAVLPCSEKENETREHMERFLKCAESENMALCGGHTQYSDHVTAPVYTCVVTGKSAFTEGAAADVSAESGKRVTAADLTDCDIVMTKYAGDAGAMVLCRGEFDTLAEKYTESWLSETFSAADRLSCRTEVEILRKYTECMHDVSEGGILAALYEAAEGHNFGFRVNITAIPVHQETVEICETLDANPYRLLSTGCMLAFVKNGEKAAKELMAAGVNAAVIGHTEKGKRKLLVRGEEESNLEKPSQDPVYLTERFG